MAKVTPTEVTIVFSITPAVPVRDVWPVRGLPPRRRLCFSPRYLSPFERYRIFYIFFRLSTLFGSLPFWRPSHLALGFQRHVVSNRNPFFIAFGTRRFAEDTGSGINEVCHRGGPGCLQSGTHRLFYRAGYETFWSRIDRHPSPLVRIVQVNLFK